MVWIAIVIICAVLLFLILNVFSSRRGKKSASRQTTAVLPSRRSSKEIEDSKVAIEDASSERINLSALEDSHAKHKQEGRQRVCKEATTHGRSDEVTRTYVRHDWQKLLEESIKTPFPDEWSPALPYLYKANKLEKEGADQQRVQEMLEKARQADSAATNFYMGRWSIIKKTQPSRSWEK